MVRHPSTGQNLLMAGADRHNGGTVTPAVSQRSESGQGIMCAKEGIGKYDMWYGVVCKAVMARRPSSPLQEVATRCHASP